MAQIKVNSDSWTGRDPSRAASREITPAARRKWAKGHFAIGGTGLLFLGYALFNFSDWHRLIVPAVVTLQSFLFGWHQWQKATYGG